ncbi:DUF445 family protein [Clostridium sp. DJ247]|uniref:DUF445 family protein n=1 Tax=Clostridium sp. DJ247 TaxID=2726188 RepID=UPI001625497B|nr:DUF445 family protein [Clostridium sp. DJ247]MBC2581463.1 DUF445 family protein [Clostridium sp. DJ247]
MQKLICHSFRNQETMQFNLIKEVLIGAITGYITNAIAIKMIFREYGVGKFKLGGIVVKTKKEFIDNVSSLVERDLIKDKTLISELNTDSFKKSISKLVGDFLETSIYKNTSNLRFSNIEGLDLTINKIKEYKNSWIKKHLPTVFNSVCSNIYLKHILNKEQTSYVSEALFESIIAVLKHNDFIEKGLNDFYDENKTLTFSDLLSSDFVNEVSINLEKNLRNFNMDLKNSFDTEINKAFENTINILEIDKILTGLEEEILNKRIIDFIGEKNSVALCKNLLLKINDFLQSNEGKLLVNSLSKELVNILKSIDKPILSLLTDDLKYSIDHFLKDKLRYVVKELILWIEQNKEDIEGLVEKAIDDTIDSIDDAMKKNIISMVKDKFVNDATSNFNIVSKITEYLDENTDIESITTDITDMIISYLKEEKLSHIVGILEESKVVTEANIISFITNNIINYIQYIPENYLSTLLNKKIKDICNVNLCSIFHSYIKKELLDAVKYEFIYTDKATKLVTHELIKSLRTINNVKLEEIINKEMLSSNSNNIKDMIIQQINNHKDNIINLLYNEFNKNIDKANLYDCMDDKLRNALLGIAFDKAYINTDKLLGNLKNLELKKLCDSINKIENINSSLTEVIQSLIKNNLEYILKGNVKKAVSSNLHNLKDEELQVMVEEFMGKEMKPITVIGAVLGAIVGVGMYFFDKSIAQYNYATGTIISVIVYGLVGWLTNVQAIAMIFKPYTEKRILGIKIPFTPGVIVSRKPKFAKSISAFIDEQLLNKSSIKKLFSKNKDTVHNAINKKLSRDNYKLLSEELNKNFNIISDEIYKIIVDFANNNKAKISKALTDELGNLNINNFDLSKIESKAKNQIIAKVRNIHELTDEKVYGVLNSKKSIAETIPKEFNLLIEKSLNNKVENQINNLLFYIDNHEKTHNLVLRFGKKYENILEKPVKDFIDSDNVEKLKKDLTSIIVNKISDKEIRDKLFIWLQEIISKEFRKDKKIEELLGGFFIKTLENNFTSIAEGAIKSIIKGLVNNQQAISEVAITTTKENLNFFEIMGYNMLGGDQIISSIVDNLVNDKFPAFIESKKEEIHTVLRNFINNHIAKSTIDDFNIKLQRDEMLNVINEFINNKENIQIVNNRIASITDSIVSCITNTSVKEYLKTLLINNIEDLINMFKDEAIFLKKGLSHSIHEKKPVLVNEYGSLGYNIFKEMILSKNISSFTGELHNECIKNTCEKLNNLLYNSKAIKNGLNNCIHYLFHKELKAKNVGKLLNATELNNSIFAILETIIENKEIGIDIKNIVDDIIKDIIENNLTIIDESTKGAVADILIMSMIDSAVDNFSSIINSINFRTITEKEINSMEPKEIEDLFNSFAEKYFNKLKLYGFGGAAFGFHWIVGVITFVLYIGSEMKNKIK